MSRLFARHSLNCEATKNSTTKSAIFRKQVTKPHKKREQTFRLLPFDYDKNYLLLGSLNRLQILLQSYDQIVVLPHTGTAGNQVAANHVLLQVLPVSYTHLARAIEEAELLDIKPKLGDELFMRLLTHVQFAVLINGGEYTDECRNRRHFVGLRRALAYYVWARLVKTSVNHLTRFGFVQKRDEYSQATEYRERQTAYNDAFAIADGYMKECLAYIQAKPEIFRCV